MAHGPDVWDGPLGDIAEDIVAMREIERLGAGDMLYADLVTDDDLRRHLKEARQRGDREEMAFYVGAIAGKDPGSLMRALGRIVGGDEAAGPPDLDLREDPPEAETPLM